jgi:indolepyruvate decarboxylase
MRETVGNFLLRRLEEAGVQHIFGVPGDYNLELMQQLEDRGKPAWVGNCNELNASYAADGYARLKGLGALIVTNGVGALSAINGIAGAYSEHVPVVCICGSLPARAIQRGDLMHHTLADREKGNFFRAFAEVTTAQAVLSLENAASEIDRLILTAWQRKLPVYMELPSDLAYLEIEVPDRPLQLRMPPSDGERRAACTQMILERLKGAKAPAFLLDLDADRFRLSPQIVDLAERFQMRVAILNTSKSVFPETSPWFAGMYAGAASAPEAKKAVEESDCLIAIGYRRIEVVSGFFTDRLPATTIYLNSDYVDAGEHNFQGVYLPELLDSLAQSTKPGKKKVAAAAVPAPAPIGSDGVLTQNSYWQAMQSFLRPGDVILADDGTSIIGAGGLKLPEGCSFISQAVWGSIGYSVGALLGALLAAPSRRHILFVGEGSFQLTAQELSTILRHDLKPYIFLINNHGYTIERAILGKDAKYNDVANWRYADLPKVFRRDGNAETFVAQTIEELKQVLDGKHHSLVFVESIMDKYDAPDALIKGGHAFANTDYGPRGPQFAPDAQLQVPK